MEIDEITRKILGCAFKVHTRIGPGCFESVYHRCLGHEFGKADLSYESELALPILYDGIKIDAAYRVDFRVEKIVLVEIKAVEKVLSIHEAQLLSYLQLSGVRVGLLLNFNVAHMIDGIMRRIR